MRKICLNVLAVLCFVLASSSASACSSPAEDSIQKNTLGFSATESTFAQETVNSIITIPAIPVAPSSTPALVYTETRIFPRPTTTQDKAGVTSVHDIVQGMIGRVDKERLLIDLRRLTGVEPICFDKKCYTITGRETGSTGLKWAKDYVVYQLESAGYNVERRDWTMQGFSDENIIVKKRGHVFPNEEIYFVAHLDGYLDSNPAADDDASGVASLLELSRVLSRNSLDRTVVLLFSTGEEHGVLGSRSYVAQLSQTDINIIKYMISVEMLGYDSDNDGAMQLWSGDQPLGFVKRLSEIISRYQLRLQPEFITGCN